VLGDRRVRVLALFALALVAASCGAGGREDRARSSPELPAGWTRLPPPPIVRARAVSVWTGDELFYWGGDTEYGGTHHSDGAAFVPGSRTWRRLPAGPLLGRSSAAAVWTGDEVLIWGGWVHAAAKDDGASFEPESNSWRMLPPAPLGPRVPAAAVWTGEELVLWGNKDRLAEAVDGAAYDPAADRWRTLPPAPIPLNEAAAVWTGSELVVIGALLDRNNHSRSERAQAIAYDPDADRWRSLPPNHLSPQASAAAWTGREVVAWDYELESAAYNPRLDTWRSLPDLPLRFYECYPQAVRLGTQIFAWMCGQAALFDVLSDTWSEVPPLPTEIYGRGVSGGRVVFFPGAAHEGVANALWVFKPQP
jgi:hypothetical protein